MCNCLQGWCPSFQKMKIFIFHQIRGQPPPPPQKIKNWSFFMTFGYGASDLIDGWTEFNETFTHCVIDSKNDVHLFGKWKSSFFTKLEAKTPQNWPYFVIFGCGAPDLKDGWTELNETLTHGVTDSGMMPANLENENFHFSPNYGPKKNQKLVIFHDSLMWRIRSQRWVDGL